MKNQVHNHAKSCKCRLCPSWWCLNLSQQCSILWSIILVGKFREANNNATASSKEEDDNKSSFCKPKNSEPPLQHSFITTCLSMTSHLVHSNWLFQRKDFKGQPGPTESNRMALFYNYYYWLGTSGYCMNHLGEKSFM